MSSLPRLLSFCRRGMDESVGSVRTQATGERLPSRLAPPIPVSMLLPSPKEAGRTIPTNTNQPGCLSLASLPASAWESPLQSQARLTEGSQGGESNAREPRKMQFLQLYWEKGSCKLM